MELELELELQMLESVPSSGSDEDIESKINKIDHVELNNPKFFRNV